MVEQARPTANAIRRRGPDILLGTAVWLVAAIVTAAFLWLTVDVVRRGAGACTWSFLTTAPSNAGRSGGIGPILVSTGLILGVCLAVAIPLGTATALLLSEYTRQEHIFGRTIRRSLDVLAGVPSIVFGLFGNALFCVYLHLGFSILSGGLTLSCMVLPILIRSTEEGLRSVPSEYRLGAAALGMSQTATIWHILLPAAVPGIAVGLVLGIGRALAETAALIFTSGYVDRVPGSLLDSGRALSLHIFDLSMNVAGGDRSAYASAFALIVILLILNSLATLMTRRWFSRQVTIA